MKQVETREKSPLIDLSGSTSKNQLLDPDGARLDNVTEVGQTKNLETNYKSFWICNESSYCFIRILRANFDSYHDYCPRQNLVEIMERKFTRT